MANDDQMDKTDTEGSYAATSAYASLTFTEVSLL